MLTLQSLLKDISKNIYNKLRQEQLGQVVIIVLILGTSQVRNTINMFSRCLLLYLLSSSVKRQVLTIINRLSVCDSYNVTLTLLDNIVDITKVRLSETYISQLLTYYSRKIQYALYLKSRSVQYIIILTSLNESVTRYLVLLV